jgi:hypothetical protein
MIPAPDPPAVFPRSMRKRTSKPRRHRHHVKLLKAEVMSPRIAWFSFLGFLKSLAKVLVLLGLLAALGYGARKAFDHTFHRNPDFRLQAVDLSPNDVLDEVDLVDHLKLDLAANIFDFDVKALEQELLRIPAISSARVERNLPGTLAFKITTRKPQAWIACPDENLPPTRSAGALLVDFDGFTYPCPPRQTGAAAQLPILILGSDPQHPVAAGNILEHPQYRHSLHLLKAVTAYSPEEISSIESISQENKWSLNLTTRAGTVATFGLGEHQRQLDYLNQALRHAEKKGYQIATINLIPKKNVPITVAGDGEPPRAIPVIEEEAPFGTREYRQADDLRSLLNRN